MVLQARDSLAGPPIASREEAWEEVFLDNLEVYLLKIDPGKGHNPRSVEIIGLLSFL